MTIREKIVEELKNVPDESLKDVYSFIQNIRIDTVKESQENFMSKLREIKISAPSNFSTTANIYDIEDENAS